MTHIQHPHHSPIHHSPIHPALRPATPQSKIGTRTGSPAGYSVSSHLNTQHLLSSVGHLTENNSQAMNVIQGALPTIQRIQSDFPGRTLTVVKATPGPSQMIASLTNAIKHRPAKEQAQDNLDLMAIRQADQSLRAFGVQFSEILLESSSGSIPGRSGGSAFSQS
jgi:hypothetical protein